MELNLDDIIEWDIPNWSMALDYWTEHTSQDLQAGTMLEVGSRHGGLSLWAALQGMSVLCTDMNGPSAGAIEKHAKYGVSHRIRYEALNALCIPYTDQFDVAVFKSVLGDIGRADKLENQNKAIAEIHKSLKPGGEMWFAENLVASPLHALLRKKFVAWAKNWRYMSAGEMENALSIFSEFHYITLGFLGAFGRTTGQRTVLGKLDRAFADRMVPHSWHYIIIGIARK